MCFLAGLIKNDKRSTSARNLKLIESLTGLRKPELCSSHTILSALPKQKVPENKSWRPGLLDLCRETYNRCEDSKMITAML